MREAQKKQIKQILVLLKQVSKVLAEKNHIGKKEIIIDMLQECQEAAIAIGRCLEKTEGENHSVISMLEEYCELLYQCSSDMTKENLKKLEIVLTDVESAIEDISVKKKVFFLPYNASMWDSLESVWKAANEDVNCEAHVIPIPYFDKDANGCFGEMHYEGDMYPDYVPIVHYEDVHLDEERPDKIFIHNPYDEYNLMTSVHPRFYSEKLKAYTEELIYVPYFVLDEVNPEDELAVENMAHFCQVNAILYADKVIIQSEQMKQVYVKVLTEWKGKHTQKIWEKKILGLGSPKFDKVLNHRKEDIEVPKEWLKIIRKQNGDWKKIILYNTSVTAFLQSGEQMLGKISNVFNIFQENQEDIALLWRPHPLMHTTIETMRPDLLEEYFALIERYKEEQIGIYDDTADLNRAIHLADAYYGDPSSVVQLCQKVGMPVMIQNVDVDYR